MERSSYTDGLGGSDTGGTKAIGGTPAEQMERDDAA